MQPFNNLFLLIVLFVSAQVLALPVPELIGLTYPNEGFQSHSSCSQLLIDCSTIEPGDPQRIQATSTHRLVTDNASNPFRVKRLISPSEVVGKWKELEMGSFFRQLMRDPKKIPKLVGDLTSMFGEWVATKAGHPV